MTRLLATAALLALAPAGLGAPDYQTAVAELVREVEAATNTADAGALKRRAADGVVMISKNGEIVVGHQALADYLDRMIGARASLKAMHSSVRLAGQPLALGERFAVAYGTSHDRYAFAVGPELAITTLWSAGLALEGTEWKVASIHFSFDLFDNPLLAAARRAVWWSAAAGLILGLGCGGILHWLQQRFLTQGR